MKRAKLVDELAGRIFGLRKATTGYAVTAVRIPARDGIELAADLYRPAGPPVGTLLARGPYGRGLPMSLNVARLYAARGYQVLFVSSRGTFGSGGTFLPERTEAADGQDVVAWMRKQDWFTGAFATLGGSYLGYTQWALLSDPPPELVAAVITMAPHDFARHHWGTGAFTLDFLGWSDLIAHQEDGGLAPLYRQLTVGRRLAPVMAGLPLADTAERHFNGRAPWYHDMVTTPDVADPFWAPTRHLEALERVAVPVLLQGGWQDIFLEQTVSQYERLHERGIDVALTIGPWTHVEMAAKAAQRMAQESLAWLDEHVAQQHGRVRTAPVQIYLTGAEEWRDYPVWPPSTTGHELHLTATGLTTTPADEPSHSSFTFDPARPTPTISGPLMSGGGQRRDDDLAARPDVLSFTSTPLTADLDLLGAPVVELAHTSDNPHADLFVRVSDVSPDGTSRNITEGYRRLAPDRPDAPVTITLRDIAHRFRAGHRIRLLIAGGSHPQYARNLGTGANPGTGAELHPTRHTVWHNASTLTMPTVDGQNTV